MENGYRPGAASGLTRLLFLGFLLLCLAACGNGSSGNVEKGEAEQGGEADSGGAAESRVIRIGVLEPMTGEKGEYGLQEALGVRYAHQERPSATLGGETYSVELVEMDNRSDPAYAVDAARELLEQDVSIVLGSYGTELSIAAGEAFQEAGVPFIACSCTNPALTRGNAYAFQACFQDPFQAAVLADYCVQHSYQKAAILCLEEDLDSIGLGAYFKEAFLQLDGTVLGEGRLQAAAEGLYNDDAVLADIASQDPDVLFAPIPAVYVPPLLRKAREMGISVLFAGGDAWEQGGLLENAGDVGGELVFTSFFDEAAASDGEAAAFSDGFRAYLLDNGQPAVLSPLSALGYDAYLAALSAIEAAGVPDGEAVREALHGVSLEGAAGPLSFDQDGNAQGRDTAYIKTVQEGHFVTLSTVGIPAP